MNGAIPTEFQDAGLPLIATEEVPACAVCGRREFVPFGTGYDYEIKTCRNLWCFVQCTGCGHVWLNPRPALSTLPVIYPPTYYAYSYNSQINAIAVRAKEVMDNLKMTAILRRRDQPVRSYLDIGCGEGRFLKIMEKRGISRNRNYGLELDAQVVHSLEKQGYSVFCERVESCERIPENEIDLITMFHVIEHVADPGMVIDRVSRWLSKGGLLAIETPNIDSADARMFGKTFWGGYHFPRHWHLFDSRTLSQLLTARGFKVIGTIYQTGHSFWMYSLHHALRYSDRKFLGLSSLFNPFKSVVPLALFTALDKARAALGQRTSAMLMLARKE